MLYVILPLAASLGCAAHTHATTVPAPAAATVEVATPVVQTTWVWIAPRYRIGLYKGYWHHPRYGNSYRAHQHGPPPARPHATAHWTPGHWEGHGPRRHWVSGHWK